MSTPSHYEGTHSAYASQNTPERIAYKRNLQRVQLFADLDRRMKGKKRVADELSTYLLN